VLLRDGRTDLVKCWLVAAALLSVLALASAARAEVPRLPLEQGKVHGVGSFHADRAAHASLAPGVRSRTSRPAVGFLRFVAVGPAPAYSFTTKAATVQRGTGFECHAHCTDGRVSNIRSLEMASRVLAGVAGAAVATGVALCFAQATSSERVSLVPVLRLKVSGDRAVASAGWNF